VWARWLLGAIQWFIPAKVGKAATNWSIAIEDMIHLEKEAIWQNQKDQVNLYVEKLAIMQGAFSHRRNNLSVPAQAAP
jgi:hypothetical protein